MDIKEIWKKHFAHERWLSVIRKLTEDEYYTIKKKAKLVQYIPHTCDTNDPHDGSHSREIFGIVHNNIVIFIAHTVSCIVGDCTHNYFICGIYPKEARKIIDEILEELLK